jgi:pyruvate/2-oxoglutarate dehydrogenase complex dihydrolipoamide dehydrogenase (E3) component
MDDRLLVNVVFTDPQAAMVGLTEKAARARNIPFRAASHPFPITASL